MILLTEVQRILLMWRNGDIAQVTLQRKHVAQESPSQPDVLSEEASFRSHQVEIVDVRGDLGAIEQDQVIAFLFVRHQARDHG